MTHRPIQILPFLALAAPALCQEPRRTETIRPIHQENFGRGGKARERRQGSDPREVAAAGHRASDRNP